MYIDPQYIGVVSDNSGHMKNTVLFTWMAVFLSVSGLSAQISHGGRPLSLDYFRGYSSELFVEMPSFDLEEELRLDSLEQSELRTVYRFAYKFVHQLHRGNSGINFTLPDGTKIWRLGIRSKGAYSMNLLFSDYELPEGARLFLYNADQSYILGSFNHLNNSDQGILPVAPIPGEEIIIEYQEPLHVAFSGRLTVGEINHGYRDFRGVEPGDHYPAFDCMNPLCFHTDMDNYQELGRSVVLMIIDGTRLCTGVMVNNTSNDGTPYLLTASHCLNNDFKITNPNYAKIAESIVSFFNYNSPLCETIMRGAEEMTMASTSYVAVNENIDMALLKFLEFPPVYYRPYYAGWNVEGAGVKPYVGIHHPWASVKRINFMDDDISLQTLNLQISGVNFYEQGHWCVSRWTSGSTYGGSSGSPLFDFQGHILGLLTAGQSTCSYPVNDYYYALSKAWSTSSSSSEQLAYWLDPMKTGKTKMDGMDPYADQSCYRLSNIHSLYRTKAGENLEATLLSSPASGYLFGHNSLGTKEYLEEYTQPGNIRIYGTYLVTPALSSDSKISIPDVEMMVYEGIEKPERLVYSEKFSPMFIHWESGADNFQDSVKSISRDQESFILFKEPVEVSDHFYIGYKLVNSLDLSFMVFNLAPGETSYNTAWICYQDEWIKAAEHPVKAFPTSLFIDPVVLYTESPTSGSGMKDEKEVHIIVGTDRQSLHILLEKETQRAEVTVYTINGQIIKEAVFSGNEYVLRIDRPGVGMYVVQIKFDNKYYHQKLIF